MNLSKETLELIDKANGYALRAKGSEKCNAFVEGAISALTTPSIFKSAGLTSVPKVGKSAEEIEHFTKYGPFFIDDIKPLLIKWSDKQIMVSKLTELLNEKAREYASRFTSPLSDEDLVKESEDLYPLYRYEINSGQRLINEENKFKREAHIKDRKMGLGGGWVKVEDAPKENGHYLIWDNGWYEALFHKGVWKTIEKCIPGVLSDFRATVNPTHWKQITPPQTK